MTPHHELKRGPTGRRSSSARHFGCDFQDMKPPKYSWILRKSSNIRKPIQCVKFRKAVVRHADIRDQNPSLGYIGPGEPHQRHSHAPKFEDRSEVETEWQERCAREAAWMPVTKACYNFRSKINQHSSHLLQIGACLRHQLLNLRNENLLSTQERRCT